MKEYTVLIVDLKQSRLYSVDDRISIQNYILEVIRELNTIFVHKLVRKVEFSAGDEMQGLFLSPVAAYLYFRLLNMLLFPVEIRAGIGIGEWGVKIKGASTTVQDGLAYHNARYAIDEVKNTVGDSLLFYSGDENDILINGSVEAAFMMTQRHSEYQNKLMLLSELLYPIDVNESIDATKMDSLFQLAMHKERVDYYICAKKKGSVKRYPLGELAYQNLQIQPIHALDDDSTFYVRSGRKRGLAVQLSDMLEVSRQSVEKNLKSANVYAARNATIVVLKLIDKYFMKGKK